MCFFMFTKLRFKTVVTSISVVNSIAVHNPIGLLKKLYSIFNLTHSTYVDKP